MFYIGAAYYPELWDKSEILKDVERMKAVGINCVRVGEFAWSAMEKNEGEYDFSLFKYMLDVMYENGIYTVLCTPSCTPPRWLFEKYPDAMLTKSINYTKPQPKVYSRCHLCKSHKGVRELNSIIAEKMSEALGSHPGVIGWQIDNELYAYDYGCFCDNCIKGFREHLKKKYGDIESLNKSWGMYRWSLNYSSFDQIEPPVPNTWENPSRQTEWLTYQNSLIYTYAWEQADAIRKHSKAPIGTDMMNCENILSYDIMNSKLDVVQHNHYDEQGEMYKALFFFDFCRALKDKPFWVTETQPGWNGSIGAYGGYRQGAHCYINTIAPIAKGAEMNLYWHYRSHFAGHELGHGAILNSAGRPNSVTPYIKKAYDHITKASDFLSGSKVKSKIAMTFSTTAHISLKFSPIIAYLDHNIIGRTVDEFYDAFRHYNIDVIETTKELDGYEVIVAPLLTCFEDGGFKDRVIKWVNDGGKLIVGPLSDIMTEYTAKHINAPYSCLEELAGVKTIYQLPVEEKEYRAKWDDGKGEFSVCLGCDAYETVTATSLATYSNVPDLNGLCAIAKNKVGKGEVIILGTAPEKEALLRLVDMEPNGIASKNVVITKREGQENGLIAYEIENKEGYIDLDKEYYDIINERKVSGRVGMKPYEALFLRA